MIPDDEALLKLHPAEVAEDKAETERRRDLVLELAGDILPVCLSGVSIWAAVWDRIVFWRGADTILYDLADRPDFIHRLMTRLLELEMDQLDQYEALGLLDAEMETIHCAGTFCEELPGADYDPENPLARNCWVAGAAQIFSEVSPAMHDEFEIEYMKPYYERFGLVNYGCCEPLHRKIDIIRKIPNVRLISISPWADVEMAAEKIGGDYVMARKPNPAFVAMDTFDPQLIAEETKATLEACRRNGTPCEFILKDITTVRNQPERLTWWYKTVKNTVLNYRA
jgi:hypothetical protein